MDAEKTLIELINPSFTFKLNDKEYFIKKANIEQVSQYQIKVSELNKDTEMPQSVKDLEIICYCVYLLLKTYDTTITVEIIKQSLPGTTDGLQLLSDLGFIDPQKVEMIKKMQDQLITKNFS